MDLGLQGKTALVTGASKGIGAAIAHALHAEGVALALVTRSEASLRGTVQSLKDAHRAADPTTPGAPIHALAADLSLGAEVERVAAQAIGRLGHVDILVNNAASFFAGSFFEMTDAAFEETWRVKGFGYVRMVRALAPHMQTRGGGSIINIVGSAARTPSADFIVGSMVNAALINFTRGIARELGRQNIRVNAISPGWTLTERLERKFTMEAAAQGITFEDIVRREARGIPLNRLVTTQEIARLTVVLASNTLPALTGEDIVIDGGATPSV